MACKCCCCHFLLPLVISHHSQFPLQHWHLSSTHNPLSVSLSPSLFLLYSHKRIFIKAQKYVEPASSGPFPAPIPCPLTLLLSLSLSLRLPLLLALLLFFFACRCSVNLVATTAGNTHTRRQARAPARCTLHVASCLGLWPPKLRLR